MIPIRSRAPQKIVQSPGMCVSLLHVTFIFERRGHGLAAVVWLCFRFLRLRRGVSCSTCHSTRCLGIRWEC
jgi:hypothetical protein